MMCLEVTTKKEPLFAPLRPSDNRTVYQLDYSGTETDISSMTVGTNRLQSSGGISRKSLILPLCFKTFTIEKINCHRTY